MLIVPLPADYQPHPAPGFLTLERAALERRVNASLAASGYRHVLRCEWPNLADCGGRECDQNQWECDGCERASRSWAINRRINDRTAPNA